MQKLMRSVIGFGSSHVPTSPLRVMTTTTSPLQVHRLKPDYKAYIPMSGTVTTEPCEVDVVSSEMTPTSPARSHLLKRVLSHGSNGSTSASASAALATPTYTNMPLSPSSGGVRTPKARKAVLKSNHEVIAGDGKTQQLVSDMDGLQVQSPMQDTGAGLHQIPHNSQPQPFNYDRSFSSSTDSSSNSGNPHPVPPSQLGSNYGSEGFPISDGSSGPIANGNSGGSDINGTDGGLAPSLHPVDMQMSAQAAAVVAMADEAIKQLNGTSTVYQDSSTPGFLPPENPFPPPENPFQLPENPFQLPRGYANFVKPQSHGDPSIPPNHPASRQSSTSSSTTEASTSSEESDLCIPSIEWVNLPNPISPAMAHGPAHSPQMHSPLNTFPQQQKRASGWSPGRIVLPTTSSRGVTSPRRSSAVLPSTIGTPPQPPSLSHQQSLPLGATAQTPGGVRQQTSALPAGLPIDAPTEDDDDDATVGHGRERSPSSSSQSAQSGLDLLWRAAATHRDSVTPSSPYDAPYDGKGKRKVGAAAVAQWRESGIPSGKLGKDVAEKARSQEVQKILSPLPLKKRRRSELLEAIDPELRHAEVDDGTAMEIDPGSDYQSGSASEEVDIVSGDDSEYGGSRMRGRATGRGRPGGRKVGRTKASTGMVTGTTVATNSGKASGPKKGRISGESPSGSGPSGTGGSGGRRASASAPALGVQCEYVNPLPVGPDLLPIALASRLTFNSSHLIDATIFSRASTIFRDIWHGMLDVKASLYTRANWPRTRRYCGRLLKISQRSPACNAVRALRGEQMSLRLHPVDSLMTLRFPGWTR